MLLFKDDEGRMATNSRVGKWGNSTVVSIPPHFKSFYGLERGDEVIITALSDNSFMVEVKKQ